MNNTLIDNSTEQLSMLQTLKNCFASDDILTVRIATGYWDIPGLALLSNDIKSFLEKEGTQLLLLIGKDPFVYASQVKNPKYKDLSYPADFIRTDLCELEPKDEFVNAVRLLLDYCTEEENSKIQIRIYRKNEDDSTQFLHSKCYIFDGWNSGKGYGLIGSSNFTEKGLQGNAELNYLETNPSIVLSKDPIPNHKTHIQWFKEKWELSEPWNKEFLEQVLKPTPIATKAAQPAPAQSQQGIEPFTPYEQYIKLLQIKFGDLVDKKLGEQIESYLPAQINKLNFQIEAVKRCLSIMHEHGGFMLADVVGLGKTIIGTLIIKRFLTVPEDDGRERKVLVITPPAILSSWKKTVEMFDKDADDKISEYIDFITTGRISNITEDEGWEDEDDEIQDSGDFEDSLQDKNYGLIVIDESHKFRNSETNMYRSLDDLIQKIGSETGVYPYIGLLSATPQNNRPNDLKNQIYLFERNHTDSTLKKAESGNIEKFFADINKEYNLLISKPRTNIDGGEFIHDIPDNERKKRLNAVSMKLRDCILSDILERRTRTDIKKYYKDDMDSQNLVFPEVIGPNNLEYIMDEELAQLFSDTMTIIAPTEADKMMTNDYLKYFRYRAIEYFVDPANEKKHSGRGNRGVSDVAKQLANIMQILLVKRLESSFTAFTQSLLNLRRYTENMIKMWDNDTIFICPQIDVNKELDIETKTSKSHKRITFNDCVDDIRAKIKKLNEQGRNDKGQNAEYCQKDFKKEYYEQLKEDYRLISNLYDRWARNSADPKFDAFKESIKPELFNPQKNTSGKLVIFSEAIDTVQSLARAVKAKGYKALVITAANRDENEHIIEENFDANYEGEWKNDFDVIITTEVLAEGVNLHRANVVLNYDTPWNSTRLMQRIGRVNRIGGKEPYVYVYNFLPSSEGDAQIQLVRKAYTKLQSFHVLFGEDSKIFSEEENVVHYDIAKAVDGEESPLQKYVYELKQYKEAHPERYNQIEQADDDWQIAQATTGTAYFIVKAPRSARLAVRIKQDADGQQNAQIISLIDLLEELRVDENAQSVDLPENWAQLTTEAIKTYNQYFVRINKSRAGAKRTQALEIIVNLYNSNNISEGSKNLLKSARKLADKGSFDIIRKMLAIGEAIKEKDTSLFTLNQQEIDEILEREIGRLVSHVETRQGEAAVVLGTIK